MTNYRRLLTSLLLLTCAFVSVADASGVENGGDSSPTSTHAVQESSHAVQNKVKVMSINASHPELVAQLQTRKGGSVKFWEAVSWCETNHDWDNSGYYAGGLGIAQSAWQGYGGWDFARSPKNATKEEQIIVANRISFFGYQTKKVFRTLDDKLANKPFFRPAIGWRSSKNWGKNCVNWETRKPSRARFTEEGMVEYKKTRPSTPVKKSSVSSMGVSSKKTTKRCPEWEAKIKKSGLYPVDKFSYIMWRESRCQEKIVSKPNSNGSRDYGLLQINSSWKTVTYKVCGGKKNDMKVLLNWECNLKVAKFLFDNGGLAHWSGSSGSN